MSVRRDLLVVDGFFDDARKLRGVLDERYADPRRTEPRRFAWDWWHVPDQYTLLRTPAWEFFPPAVYRRLHASLVKFGREQLGCWDITPPWLSCYVEGCGQQLHADVPHGPWAFVYSLTEWDARRFTGGETLLLRRSTVDYWPSFPSFRGVELPDLVERVPAEFNRLVVFDPRIPHGVTEVRGARDIPAGRLVIHGWFTEPRPFVSGALTPRAVQGPIDEVVGALGETFANYPDVHGTLTVRLDVAADGSTAKVRTLTDTLVSLAHASPELAGLERAVRRAFGKARFRKAKGPSAVTVPLVFRFES